MPRFVILWHEAGPGLARASHFDLLFEEEGDARAWFVERMIEPGVELSAGELPRHRLFYFDYEGPISGNRGAVSRWDSGTYHAVRSGEDFFEVELLGARLMGSLRLYRDRVVWKLRFVQRDSNHDHQDCSIA